MTSGRSDRPPTRPPARAARQRVFRLLATALAMSAVMSGTMLWILRRPNGRQGAIAAVTN